MNKLLPCKGKRAELYVGYPEMPPRFSVFGKEWIEGELHVWAGSLLIIYNPNGYADQPGDGFNWGDDVYDRGERKRHWRARPAHRCP